jgi:ankyrin repeat protein
MVASVMLLSSPAHAQFSKSYQFLEAVRKKDGAAVTTALDQSTTIVNTRDVTSGETPLHIVTARRDVLWMGFLLGRGADANMRDGKGQTPLVLAANMGMTDGVTLLIANGARIDEPSSIGETPLIAAVHRRDIQMMRILLKAGANPDRSDNSGRTARDYALIDGKNSQLVSEIETNAKKITSGGAGSYGPKL